LIALTLKLKILTAALATHRARATAAAAMVSLGVASTLIMVALSTGARLEMEANEDRMGRNLFYVRSAELPLSPGRGNGWYTSSRLKPEQAAQIEQAVPAVFHAEPIRERAALVKYEAHSVTTTVRGVTPQFLELRNFEVEHGRALTDSDGQALRRVAVLGPFVRERLAGASSLVGKRLQIGGVPFEVIGELRAKGAGSDGSNLDDQVLIPLETSMRRLDNVESASLLLVQAREAGGMRAAMEGVRGLLRTAHYLEPGTRDDFNILETVRQNLSRQTNGRWMRGLSKILAVVTLALGGIGVLAVSYLNVNERTGEIGLRMALGATRSSIAALFLFEACVLSVLGGISGLVVGTALAFVLRTATGWSVPIDLQVLGAALAVSGLTCVTCSLLPAWRASQVMPARTLAE
jgi:putative ABC transport system permease protein